MKRAIVASVLAGTGLALWGISGGHAAGQASEERMELAREVAELQQTRQFFQAQWKAQKAMMYEKVPAEKRTAQMKSWMNVLREETVDGQIEEWINAMASKLDAASLRAAANALENAILQQLIGEQIEEVYPAFREGVKERQRAAVSVMADEAGGFDKRKQRMADVEPVGETKLGRALGVTPGARMAGELERTYSATSRFPVAGRTIGDVFPDMSAELFPGNDGAHIVSVTGTRAYATRSACDAARGKLTGELSVYFPETDVTDCGDKRFLDADREVRMRIHCRDQQIGNHVLLTMQITHIPTRDAAYATMEH